MTNWIITFRLSDVAYVTLIITYQKENERVIQVILNPTATKYVCSKCSRVFRSRVQLRIHRNSVHKIVTGKMKNLKGLENSLSSPGAVEENRGIVEDVNDDSEKKYFQCGLCIQK